ncbi:hypothetical protein EBR66_06400 [bacterium]|nr:hypothetical protein [bacterium]
MPEISYSTIPSTSYTIPDFTAFNFTAPSISLPSIPSFTPIVIPSLPTFYTLQELIGVSDSSSVYVPYVPPAVSTFDPKLSQLRNQAITLQQELGDALADLALGYEGAQANKDTLTAYNTQLSNLTNSLNTQKTNLTNLQTTLNKNTTDLNNTSRK